MTFSTHITWTMVYCSHYQETHLEKCYTAIAVAHSCSQDIAARMLKVDLRSNVKELLIQLPTPVPNTLNFFFFLQGTFFKHVLTHTCSILASMRMMSPYPCPQSIASWDTSHVPVGCNDQSRSTTQSHTSTKDVILQCVIVVSHIQNGSTRDPQL